MARRKRRLSDLAIFGGPPLAPLPLHVGRPNLGDKSRVLRRISDILDRRWLTNGGPLVQELEETLADFLQVEHFIATSNGTLALEIATRATSMTNQVIVPAFTFVATPHSLTWQGLEPMFCDVRPATHLLDTEAVERAINPSCTGIVGVHLWGRACDVEALQAIARAHGVSLVYDAAHAFACSHRGRRLGNFGDAEVFSFHATKFVNGFEGGAIATNDPEVAAKARLMRNFGFSGYDQVDSIGTNAKMHEASAAMLLTSFEAIDDIIDHNRQIYNEYKYRLEGIPGIGLLRYDETEHNNYQYIVLEVDAAESALGRDDLMRVLWAENVLARRYFYPGCHRMEPYRSRPPDKRPVLPATEWLADRVVTMPTGQELTLEAVRDICDVIALVVSNSDRVGKALVDT
ncbi:MAG TPA: aminotransferase class I/II-fold pyridoxal phosphate-dependent enzyme [Acidimicrobiales bacterium]|nr:aminotransferase class I/II-fold pyridoxal phosphate-dependent enzyme [Acidimicrobiales bacterium]